MEEDTQNTYSFNIIHAVPKKDGLEYLKVPKFEPVFQN